ncbi:hypothetical protein GCM10011410_32400 [Hoyosella rhizosphaerae]|uniref:Uncharacterized protein n=1 Tax=Hoyosella rhizosphaerae TaxID=1755582 RepID=A0A916XJG8_9ACTN|nr:hypothetical protein GCM10011410_32400 [Hoyosella rhizosphaerae]
MLLKVGSVDFDVPIKFHWQSVVRKDGLNRALVYTGTAVDTHIGLDMKHFGRREQRICGSRMDAIDRAHRDARSIVATRLSDDVGHRIVLTVGVTVSLQCAPR